MELKLKPHDKNLFSLGAVLIQGTSVTHWLQELQRMSLSLMEVTVYPLPGNVVNTVWGCLAVCNLDKRITNIGPNGYCQRVHNLLFIPERAKIYPMLSDEELIKLLGGKLHFFHPEIGLVELEEAVDWSTVITFANAEEMPVRKPVVAAFIPGEVKTFLVKPTPADDVIQNFEEVNFPKQQKFSDKPLNPFEKAKLFLYRQLLTKRPEEGQAGGVEKTSLLSKLERWLQSLSGKESNWTAQLQSDFEELERRNQKHLDRLLDLLKNNPEEALKYAIPLDAGGSGRGGFNAEFLLQKRWFDFSLFGNGSSSGPAAASGDAYFRLQQQYTVTAQALVKEGDYRKAAFVYMKLLKNYPKAAETLAEGKLYAEAASVYLKYANDKAKAAECFEKGAMIEAAIDLHKELGNDEKVGDLYLSTHKKVEAFRHYQKVADDYESHHQYLKASLLYKKKMEAETAAQQTLLKGWRLNRDAFNCLNNYFANIYDEKALGEAIQSIYQKEITASNRETFLRVLQYEYAKGNGLAPMIKDNAYQIVSEAVKDNPAIVSELKSFNKDDKQLIKDTLRFKISVRKD